MSNVRFLMTQSLLAAWQYQYQAQDQETAHRDFLKTLNREPMQPNKAMLDGIQFENMVTAYCEGNPPREDHEWLEGIKGVGDRVRGCQFQVAAYREIVVGKVPFLLYGRLDGLRAGNIFDIKFSRTYQPGKYLGSPQHPMYFCCVPEAKRFDYVVYTGSDVCVEIYRPGEGEPVEQTIRQFMGYLEETGLAPVYIEKWRAK